MATITLYSGKINQMSSLINKAKTSVKSYKSDLKSLKSKVLSIDESICDVDDVISSIKSSTKTQEDKIETLENLKQDINDFISDVVRIDGDAADAINKSKDDFYDKYEYLKPECEKSGWEKFKDGCKKVGEWCKEHWKELIIGAICIVIGAVLTVFSGGTFLAGLAACFGKAILTATVFGAISVGFSALASKILDRPFTFNDALSAFGDGFASGFMFGGLGALGGAAGKLISCESILGSAINITFKVTGVASLGFVGLDILSLVDYAVEPESNPIADFCSSEGYRTVENVIFGIAAFTGGASKSMTCFVAGTMILTATGLVAIENIKAGDKVISTDLETFETAEKTVVETYVREDSKLIHLVINGEEIVTTVDHPFYVKNQGFIKAGELIVGDELLDVNGNILLVENFDVELTDKPVKVYNFQVEDFHTYYVGKNGILVHNADYSTVVTPDMENKILEGERVGSSNRIKGGHSPKINDANPKYSVEVQQTFPDGTKKIKFITEFPDGNVSKIKTSTIFPDNWSDAKIIDSIKQVGDGVPIGKRIADNSYLYRDIIDGVQIEVIKQGNNVIAGYPTGGGTTGLPTGFTSK